MMHRTQAHKTEPMRRLPPLDRHRGLRPGRPARLDQGRRGGTGAVRRPRSAAASRRSSASSASRCSSGATRRWCSTPTASGCSRRSRRRSMRLTDAVEAMTSGAEVLRLRLGVLPLFASQRLFPRLRRTARRASRAAPRHRYRRARHRRGSATGSTRRSCSPATSIPRSTRSGSTATRSMSIGAQVAGRGAGPDHAARAARRADRAGPPRHARHLRPRGAQAAGLRDLEPLAIDHFDSGTLMLEAAAQGLGVAFMLDSHFEDAQRSAAGPAVRSRGREPVQLLVRLPPARAQTNARSSCSTTG